MSDAIFLAPPVPWRGTLTEYAGRLHRLYDMKKEVFVYDYVDFDVQKLAMMYEICISASAGGHL